MIGRVCGLSFVHRWRRKLLSLDEGAGESGKVLVHVLFGRLCDDTIEAEIG